MKGIVDGIINVTVGTVKGAKILANPEILINQIKDICPDLVLIVLMALIILRYIGFKGTSKYMALTLVVAVCIALL